MKVDIPYYTNMYSFSIFKLLSWICRAWTTTWHENMNTFLDISKHI